MRNMLMSGEVSLKAAFDQQLVDHLGAVQEIVNTERIFLAVKDVEEEYVQPRMKAIFA